VAERTPGALRVAVVGLSTARICGVKDHATLLAEELDANGSSCTMHWLTRGERSLRAAGAELDAWLTGVARDLRRERPDVILLHYSVFAYGYAGIPLFVTRILRTLRRTGVPVVAVLHEFVYPWRKGGLRGKVWAATQRLAFIHVLRCSAAVLVTTEDRAHWITRRRWLPTRPTAFAPVFSNLPSPSPTAVRPGEIGLFGYSFDDATVPLVLDALRQLNDGSRRIGLALLGAPGSDSPSARAWREAAAARGMADALSFSGTLSAQELSDALASCEVLLSVATGGPSSRKGTLAGSLAAGRPVVATDGWMAWSELVQSGAAIVVEPTASALAGAVGELLRDQRAREELGASSRRFAMERMGVARTAHAVVGLLDAAGVNRAR
jgi:glycosyltransferase involved in cell wall biosynthesis